MQGNNEGNSLGAFFKMIDLIEDDISEMLEDENSELSGYECLIISFNCLTLLCRQVEINFSFVKHCYHVFMIQNSSWPAISRYFG
mgnify:CR=1 FL=1